MTTDTSNAGGVADLARTCASRPFPATTTRSSPVRVATACTSRASALRDPRTGPGGNRYSPTSSMMPIRHESSRSRRAVADEDAGRPALVRPRRRGGGRTPSSRRQPPGRPEAHRHLEDLVARQRREQRPPRRAALQHADERRPKSAHAPPVSSHYLGVGGAAMSASSRRSSPGQRHRPHQPPVPVVRAVGVDREHAQRIRDRVDRADVVPVQHGSSLMVGCRSEASAAVPSTAAIARSVAHTGGW